MSPDQHPVTFHSNPTLDRPILIAAFRGWNDAGDSATFAAEHLGRAWSAQRLASIDPEEFYDFQAVRPHVELVEGLTRKITWPSNVFSAAPSSQGRDAIILIGTEPNLRWKTFAGLVVELAQKYEVSLVVTLGALLADVPHSRPIQVTGTAMDPALVEELGLHQSRYEGPTGIVGILHDALAASEMRSASLWAAVPHYLAVTPNPKAALALINKTVPLVGIAADVSDLERATTTYEERVAEMVASDEDVQAYVRFLEERADERAEDVDKLPSGEALAAELESFLRQHDGEDQV